MSTRFRYCGELLSNAGFETAGAGGEPHASWTKHAGSGAVADETTIKHAGSHALKLTAGASEDTWSQQAFTVRPGFHYTMTVYAYGTGSVAGKIGVWDATNSANIIAPTTTGITAAAWGLVTVAFTAPATCLQVSLTLWAAPGTGGIVYFDDASVLPADFDFDADAERFFEEVGEPRPAASGKLYYNPLSPTGLRKCWRVSMRNIDPDEAAMMEAAFRAAVLDDSNVYWMAWDETTATKVRTRPSEWNDKGAHRADATDLRTISFTLREETPT